MDSNQKRFNHSKYPKLYGFLWNAHAKCFTLHSKRGKISYLQSLECVDSIGASASLSLLVLRGEDVVGQNRLRNCTRSSASFPSLTALIVVLRLGCSRSGVLTEWNQVSKLKYNSDLTKNRKS